jgi:hypothetical protein
MVAENAVGVAALTANVPGVGVEPPVDVNVIGLGENVSAPPPPPLPVTTKRTGTLSGLLAAPVCVNVMEPL